jgi:N-methylhydantoinase A
VTDANVVLGRIPSSTRLGGALDLDRAAARDVIATLAEDRGLSVEETAQGIVDMVTQDVYSALRVVSVEKGYDPREFGLVAFGGAGPLHADAVGSRIQASPVVIPPAPGVMSAFGFLTSDVRKEFAEAYVRNSEEVDGAELHERLLALRQEAAGWLTDEEVASDSRAYDYYLECRYYRQDIQITVPVVPDELTDDDGLASIRSRFENRYENQYGFTLDSPLEFVNLRVVGHGSVQGVTLSESSPTGTDIKSARLGYEDVYFGEKYYETPVYRRRDLYPGNELDGPAVVIEDDATTVVQPDSVATVNRYGCLEIRGGA